MQATTKIMIGFKAFDGLTYIAPLIVGNDMGNHGMITPPLKTKLGENIFAKFIWASKKTGNCIYKEITEQEYQTHYKDKK